MLHAKIKNLQYTHRNSIFPPPSKWDILIKISHTEEKEKLGDKLCSTLADPDSSHL